MRTNMVEKDGAAGIIAGREHPRGGETSSDLDPRAKILYESSRCVRAGLTSA